MYVHHVDGARKNVVKNSGTTVKNSTVKNRKSSVSYTITYFLLCFARQAWLLAVWGAAAPQKRHPAPRQLVLDGRRLHEIRARRSGHFSMPATVLHRSESYLSVPWHLSMPRVGPWKGPTARSEGIQQKLGGSGATRARPMALKGATGRDR